MTIAVGQPRLQYVANVNYTVPWWPVLSLDLAAISSEPNRPAWTWVCTPTVTQLNLGGRYKFTILG